MNLFKPKWRTAAILKIVFDHNSVTDFTISVKFCVGSSFWQNFSNGTETLVAPNVFLFRHIVGALASERSLSYCLWSSYCLRQYEDQRQYERICLRYICFGSLCIKFSVYRGL